MWNSSSTQRWGTPSPPAGNAAKQDRIGIFNAYKDNNSPAEFYDIMMTLSGRCVHGDGDIPKDAEKAAYWRAVGEGKSEKS